MKKIIKITKPLLLLSLLLGFLFTNFTIDYHNDVGIISVENTFTQEVDADDIEIPCIGTFQRGGEETHLACYFELGGSWYTCKWITDILWHDYWSMCIPRYPFPPNS